MLTRDLLRYRLAGDAVQPFLLRRGETGRAAAAALLTEWRALVGRPRDELDEATEALAAGARSPQLVRGLARVLARQATFAEPESARALREAVCAASARLLAVPAADAVAHRAAVAAELGLPAEELPTRLYADLPGEARLSALPPIDPEDLAAAYDLALVQGLLLHARELSATIADADVGRRRRLLKALRFLRLLAEVREGKDGLELAVSGPLAVLERRATYGLAFAKLLPHLASARRWSLRAQLDLPGGRGGTLALDQGSGLRAHSRFTAYVPEELRHLGEQLARREPDWRVDDEAPILRAADGTLLAPDLRLRTPAGEWCVECFHRWHARPLAARLAEREAGGLPRLLLAVDRDLLRLAAHAALAARVAALPGAFAFAGFPTVRALRAAIAAVAGTGAGAGDR